MPSVALKKSRTSNTGTNGSPNNQDGLILKMGRHNRVPNLQTVAQILVWENFKECRLFVVDKYLMPVLLLCCRERIEVAIR